MGGRAQTIIREYEDGITTQLEFFRHCPGCGDRFHIKFEGKQLVGVLDKETMMTPTTLVGMRVHPVVEPGYPVTVDVDEFQDNYKCKLCGHEWSEKRIERHVEKGSTSC